MIIIIMILLLLLLLLLMIIIVIAIIITIINDKVGRCPMAQRGAPRVGASCLALAAVVICAAQLGQSAPQRLELGWSGPVGGMLPGK